jgi:hypothetical protein
MSHSPGRSLLAGLTGLAFAWAPLRAQVERAVRGTVRDAATGQPLGDAVVARLGAERSTHASTTAQGRFALTIPSDSVTLVAVRIGFAPETLQVAPTAREVAFQLHPAPVTLDPITVQADQEHTYSTASSRAIEDLDIRLRPRESSQELLRLAPGLVVAQHAGGGKAE